MRRAVGPRRAALSAAEAALTALRTLALVVEYDGTHFAGFQRQPEARTVAGALETALCALFQHEVSLVCAGRTDAGVHATGQVVSFTTQSDLPLWRIPIAASAILRKAKIAVLSACERPSQFSARHDALARTYRYRILNRAAPSPLYALRAFHTRAMLDIDSMKSAADTLVGEHDFTAYCTSPPQCGRNVRTITALSVERAGDFVDVWITADSFLHQMVRIVVGTLVEIGCAKRPRDDARTVLGSRNRIHAGFTAPPHGLYLERVHYADPIPM